MPVAFLRMGRNEEVRMSPLSGVRHILYLTDLSAAASTPYQYALLLAQRLQAQVDIVYWTAHVGYSWTVAPIAAMAVGESASDPAKVLLDAMLDRPDLKQITVDNAAEFAPGERGTEMVVLSLSSKQVMQEIIFESLPEILLRDLRCPLWVVGPKGIAADRPADAIDLPGSSHVTPPRRILYASPLRHDGRAPELARYFAGIEQGELTLLHVLPYTFEAAPDETVRKGSDFDSAGQALAALLDADPPSPLRIAVRSAVTRAEGILEEAKSQDLVVLPVEALTAWTLVGGGTISQIVEEIRCPLLLVPERWGNKRC